MKRAWLRRGFSLVEAVLASALFACAAFVITQTCYNCALPLTVADPDPLDEAFAERCVLAVSEITDYDALDDGTDVFGLEEPTMRKVYAEAVPTDILDLFEVSVKCQTKHGEVERRILLFRDSSWYENSVDRENLVKDRTEYLDDVRRAESRNFSRTGGEADSENPDASGSENTSETDAVQSGRDFFGPFDVETSTEDAAERLWRNSR